MASGEIKERFHSIESAKAPFHYVCHTVVDRKPCTKIGHSANGTAAAEMFAISIHVVFAGNGKIYLPIVTKIVANQAPDGWSISIGIVKGQHVLLGH